MSMNSHDMTSLVDSMIHCQVLWFLKGIKLQHLYLQCRDGQPQQRRRRVGAAPALIRPEDAILWAGPQTKGTSRFAELGCWMHGPITPEAESTTRETQVFLSHSMLTSSLAPRHYHNILWLASYHYLEESFLHTRNIHFAHKDIFGLHIRLDVTLPRRMAFQCQECYDVNLTLTQTALLNPVSETDCSQIGHSCSKASSL